MLFNKQLFRPISTDLPVLFEVTSVTIMFLNYDSEKYDNFIQNTPFYINLKKCV